MSAVIIPQQITTQTSLVELLDGFEKVFPLGLGLKIYPRRPGESRKRPFTTQLTREMVLDAYAFGTYAVGSYLAKQGKTRLCVIDLDAGGGYHNLAAVQALIKTAQGFGLDLHFMRSSSSGGWHLVGFFSEPVSNIQLATVLQAIVLRSGLHLAAGQCEIYPWPGASRRAVRLPFQPESAWLDPSNGSVTLEAAVLSTQGRLQELLLRANASTTTAKTLKKAYETARKRLPKKAASPGTRRKRPLQGTSRAVTSLAGLSAADRFEKGKQFYEDGLTCAGQLNDALFLVGYYLFRKDPDRFGNDHPDQREAEMQAWVKAKHNGMSRTINGGDWPVVDAEIYRMAHTCRRKERRKGGEARYKLVNQQRQLEAKLKLEDAIMGLHLEGSSALAVSHSELARRAGVSRPTVVKHWELIKGLDQMAAAGERIVHV